jgi:hypothetical protein
VSSPADLEWPDSGTVLCPTCRAAQEWSDTCRRCKSDLRLLRAFAGAYRRCRHACRVHLDAGRPRAALHAARRCHAVAPTPESRRLLAVSALLAGDFAAAVDLARPAGDD